MSVHLHPTSIELLPDSTRCNPCLRLQATFEGEAHLTLSSLGTTSIPFKARYRSKGRLTTTSGLSFLQENTPHQFTITLLHLPETWSDVLTEPIRKKLDLSLTTNSISPDKKPLFPNNLPLINLSLPNSPALAITNLVVQPIQGTHTLSFDVVMNAPPDSSVPPITKSTPNITTTAIQLQHAFQNHSAALNQTILYPISLLAAAANTLTHHHTEFAITLPTLQDNNNFLIHYAVRHTDGICQIHLESGQIQSLVVQDASASNNNTDPSIDPNNHNYVNTIKQTTSWSVKTSTPSQNDPTLQPYSSLPDKERELLISHAKKLQNALVDTLSISFNYSNN